MSSRILVIRGGAIGDFILTLPAIRLLRESLPGNHLEILGYPAVTRLALEAGIADEVRSIEYAGLANFFNPEGDLDPELVDYFAGFNLVISYLYDPDGYFGGNLERCGVKTHLACSHRIDEAGASAAAQLAAPLEQVALFLEDPAPRLDFPEALHRSATALAGSPTAPIAIHPGSGSPGKNWPIESWIEAVDRLRRHHRAHPLFLLTGEADVESAEPLIAHCRRRHPEIRHFHAIDLPLLGAFLSRCTLFLGHDSGISHLAAAAGAPSLLLFGPTKPEIWAPANDHVTVLRSPSSEVGDIGDEEFDAMLAQVLSPSS